LTSKSSGVQCLYGCVVAILFSWLEQMLQCHGTAWPTSTIQTMSQFPSIVSIQGWALLSSSDWCPQKSLPEGNDYCERKIKFLKANHDKLVEVAGSKQNTAEQVAMVLQAKMRQSTTTTEP
jgi:hypothetical protein